MQRSFLFSLIDQLQTHIKTGFVFFVLSCIAYLLVACSTTRHDGPPRWPVDVSQIPNAKPKVEAKSKYGNPPVYNIHGKNYWVMSSSKGYEEKGIASWYGTKFHHHATSNGERYNMLAMTAAHRTLPLPTYVEVTNLKNGRKVIVRINDRGPFANNRIIDLSYAAARKLGMVGHGTAYVDVRAIDPERHREPLQNDFWLASNRKTTTPTPIVKKTQTASLTKKYSTGIYLQVGAFKNRLFAERLKDKLSRLSASPVTIVRRADKNNLYRVEIGPIQDSNTAKRIRQQIGLAGGGEIKTIHRTMEA